MSSPKISRRFASVSELELEEFLCGDASEAVQGKISELARSNSEFAEHVREREAGRAAFQLQHPRLRSAEPTPSRRRTWGWTLACSSVVVAAAAIFVVSRPEESVSSQIRQRGAVKASLAVRRDGRVFAHGEGVLLRKADQVRLTVESSRGGYLSLLGRDELGIVSIYYDSVPIAAGTATLPGSLVLDDFVGEEKWYVIVTEAQVTAESLAERLRSNDALGVPATALVLVKEETW